MDSLVGKRCQACWRVLKKLWRTVAHAPRPRARKGVDRVFQAR